MSQIYYCSRHSMEHVMTNATRDYGKHRCSFCGRQAKYAGETADVIDIKTDAETAVEAMTRTEPPKDYVDEACTEVEPDFDDWEYRAKDKAAAIKATFYTTAILGACYCVYALANL